jgi:hypothetical protein
MRRFWICRVGLVAQHVFGQREHDRAGAAGVGEVEGAGDEFGRAGGVVDLIRPFGDGRMSTSWNASRPRMARATWPTNMISGVESWRATWMPADALVAPGPRVTMTTPGWPVSLPHASAAIAAAPSWRKTVTAMLVS